MKIDKNYDFYQNTFSYIKVLKRFLPELFNGNMECALKEMYNNMLQDIDAVKLMKLQIVAGLLENKLLKMGEQERRIVASELYQTYLQSMYICYCNNKKDFLGVLFNHFSERVIELSGYLGIYGENDEATLSFALRK